MIGERNLLKIAFLAPKSFPHAISLCISQYSALKTYGNLRFSGSIFIIGSEIFAGQAEQLGG
jgi:hypothetical protein